VSKKFIQTKFYPHGKDEHAFNLFSSLLGEEDFKGQIDIGALVLPKDMPERKLYTKSLIECCVNILQSVTQNLRPSGEKQDGTTDMGVNSRLQFIVRTMADTLQWIVNSTSWSEEKFLDFDSFEIKNKLSLITGRKD
jgi:hypothetical protein